MKRDNWKETEQYSQAKKRLKAKARPRNKYKKQQAGFYNRIEAISQCCLILKSIAKFKNKKSNKKAKKD